MASLLLLALLLSAPAPASPPAPAEPLETRLLLSPLAGMGFGGLTAMGGALALSVASLPYCHLPSGHPGAPACERMLLTGAAVGFGVGAALGVTLSGERLGARGRRDVTFAVATLLPFFGSLAYHLLSPPEGPPLGLTLGAGVALVVGLPLVTGLTYELSAPPPSPARAPALPALAPLALPLPGGGVAGVAGRF